MKSFILALAMTLFSATAFASASDYGWRHLEFTSQETTQFSLDVRLVAITYSLGTVYNSDVWVHVNDSMVTEAKMVVLNYFDGNTKPAEVKEVQLVHNAAKGVFEAPAYIQVSLMRGGELTPSRQEIAIRVNGNQWLKNSDNQSNFKFNVLDTYGIRY